MKIIDIEKIDDIAEEIKERLCPYEFDDDNKREEFELEVYEILVKNLRKYIKGDY